MDDGIELDLLTESDQSNEVDHSNQVNNPKEFEKILETDIGEFGPYQILAAAITGFISASASFVTINFIFSAAILDHRYTVHF